MRRSDAIAEVYEGFRLGRRDAVAEVEGWIRAVVHGANWRFRDPEEVRQDALLELHRAARSGAVRDPRAFQKLVYVVAKRVCVDRYHRERRRSTIETEAHPDAPEPTSSSDPTADLDRRRRWSALLEVFQRLSPSCRDLWDLVYGEALGATEIANRLGISPGAVRVRAHRCLEKAREIARRSGHDALPRTAGEGSA